MSLFPFFRNFLGASGEKATKSLVLALVKLDPDAASTADMRTMEQDMDAVGRLIAEMRQDLVRETRERDQVKTTYGQLMGAAEVLDRAIKDPATTAEVKASKEASLGALLSRIETVSAQLKHEEQDVVQTQQMLDEAEAAFKEKAAKLVTSKATLADAKRDLRQASIEEQRAADRADKAAQVAGLRESSVSGLTTALDSMRTAADEARARAASADMKADVLKGASDASGDLNIAAALQEVSGKPATASLDDRLAALRAQK